MESDCLSMYHQAHFSPVGHEMVHMENSSREYPQKSVSQSRLTVDSNTDQIQTINMTQTSHDTGCDYKSFGLGEYMEDGEELEKAICRQEMNVDFYDDKIIQFDKSLVGACECCDYEVIIVNPDLVDISSDDDQHDLEAEYINCDDRSCQEINHEDRNTISQDGPGIDLDSPLLFNIDKYLIDSNNNNDHLLNTDDPVVKDVKKYLINDNDQDLLNMNIFYIKHKISEKESTQFHIPVSTVNVEECLISVVKKDLVEEKTEIVNETDNCKVIDQNTISNEEILINEADLEFLSTFDGLEDYFLPDMTKTKFSHIQTSYLSPQSPMQNIGMDIDDEKTCMRVNGDLSDLASDMVSKENASKSYVIPEILTDKENSYQFNINNKIEAKLVSGKNDLDHKDEKIKRPSNSRSPIPRSCKSKKVLYYPRSDNKTDNNENDKKIAKKSIKPSVKPPLKSSKCHKKLSPPHRELNSYREKPNSSVMNQSAFKASDLCSEKSTNSLKLTIKNKSQVIPHWQHIESQKDKSMDKNEKSFKEITKFGERQEKNIKELETSNGIIVCNVETNSIKEKSRSENKNLYTTLFSSKQHNQVPQTLQFKRENRTSDSELNKCMLEVDTKKDTEEHMKKEKKECKLRKDISQNNSFVIVSPKVPDIPNPLSNNVIKCQQTQTTSNGLHNSLDKGNNKQNFFDPIKEAARVVLLAKKRKAEAMRKKDEEIVNSRLLKTKKQIENFQLQPLFSNAETMEFVGITKPEITPVPIKDLQSSSDYEKRILINIGTNTDEKMFSYVKEPVVDKKTYSNIKLDKKRYKNIMATLESVRKQVDTKILRNSLFSSIQDVVLRNAPKEAEKYLQEKREIFTKTKIVREYDPKADYGEDKVVLHLDKRRWKPSFSNKAIQTNPIFAELPILAPISKDQVGAVNKKRKYNDLRGLSRSHQSNEHQPKKSKREERVSNQKELRLEQNETKEMRSREIAKPITSPLREPTVSESLDSSSRESNVPEEERKIVFVGRVAKDVTKQTLRNQFSKFGRVTEVRIHTKKNGYRYGFVTYQQARDAWSAVKESSTFPQYNVGFGGRRAFCRQSYADLDGLDIKHTEKAYYGEAVPPLTQRDGDMSFDQMLLDMKKKLGQIKYDRPKS